MTQRYLHARPAREMAKAFTAVFELSPTVATEAEALRSSNYRRSAASNREPQVSLIGHSVVASTATGRGPLSLARARAESRPAPPDGGEVPRAAIGRSPKVRALSMSNP